MTDSSTRIENDRQGRSTLIKIGIIGVGFSGTVLALHLHRLSKMPIEIVLFEKRACFGLGEAYSTPYHFIITFQPIT